MSRLRIVAGFVLTVVGLAAAVGEEVTSSRTWTNCQGGSGIWSDLRLSSCNEIIKSGKAAGADLAKAYYYRGNAHLMQSEYRKAIDDYTRSNEIVKGDANVLHERCWARAVLNVELEDALSDCNESLRIKPNDGESLGGRGFLYLKLGFYRTSILDYDAALAAKPNNAEYLFGRATAKTKAGDADGATADFAAARAADLKIDAVFARYDEASGGKGFWGALAGYWGAMMKWVY
jgi:tetratricopeptide (TPR) repeat protein